METAGQAQEILGVLRSLYQRHLACDFVIVISEPEMVEFRVHRAMLAAFSGKFKKLLESGQLQNDRYTMQCKKYTMQGIMLYVTGTMQGECCVCTGTHVSMSNTRTNAVLSLFLRLLNAHTRLYRFNRLD